MTIDINELRKVIADCYWPTSPVTIKELLDRLEAAEKERDELRVELETERARLAACGVVALANTPDSAKRARDMRPEYWSASCGDVASLVDENIKLRAKIEAAEKSDAESIAMYRKARDERDELRAKIEQMERQEPIAYMPLVTVAQLESGGSGVVWCPHDRSVSDVPVYARPGAQPKPDCGEAGHDEGRCGNRQRLPGAQTQGEGK